MWSNPNARVCTIYYRLDMHVYLRNRQEAYCKKDSNQTLTKAPEFDSLQRLVRAPLPVTFASKHASNSFFVHKNANCLLQLCLTLHFECFLYLYVPKASDRMQGTHKADFLPGPKWYKSLYFSTEYSPPPLITLMTRCWLKLRYIIMTYCIQRFRGSARLLWLRCFSCPGRSPLRPKHHTERLFSLWGHLKTRLFRFR